MSFGPCRVSDHVMGLGYGRFCVYLVKGEQTALVEVGIAATAPLVLAQIEELGHGGVDHLIVTHPHPDHLTGLGPLRTAMPQATVWCADVCARVADNPKGLAGINFESEYMGRVVKGDGVPGAEGAHAPFEGLGAYRPLNDGDRLDLGRGVILTAKGASGHAPGGLMIHLGVDGAVFVSDETGFYYPPDLVCPVFMVSFFGYLAGLDWLESLGAGHVCLPHQGHVSGERAGPYLRLARTGAEETRDEVLRRLRAGEAEKEIAADLSRRYYVRQMTLYSPQNIDLCTSLIVRRAVESDGD